MTWKPEPGERPTASAEKQPQLGNPDYNLATFARDLSDGQLRWLASVLAVGSIVLLVWALLDPALEIFWPIHLRGSMLIWSNAGLAILWTAAAVINWMNWWKTRRLSARNSEDR